MDYKLFTEKSINYLTSYIENNKLQSLILGISGGIDSTVVAALASEACKKTGAKLIGRSLPAHSNNPEEINTATLVGQAFCDDFKEVAIERIYAKVADGFELNEGKMSTLQLGNIKARLRMMYLYNLASIHRGCVLDTDNRTEHELGFWTIHGDVGDLNCGLIYLWKTEVYELAKYLIDECQHNAALDSNKHEVDINGIWWPKMVALKDSMNLTPTDGNGVMSGGDCAQFGLDNYNQVDDVLKTMYFNNIEDETEKANEYIRLIDSYNEQGVDKVMVRHQNSAFKRLPQPIYPNKEELGL
jgi:NAD+ synthetase